MNTLNLSKGGTLNLTKGHSNTIDEKSTFGLGWRGKGGRTLDLDSYVAVFAGDKVIDFIYFGKKIGKGIKHNGDDTVGGGSGKAPNETINAKISSLDPSATKLIFGAAIYSGATSLSEVDFAFCTLQDKSGQEVVRFKIDEQFGKARSFDAASVEKVNGDWIFTALGVASQDDFRGVRSRFSIGSSNSNSGYSSTGYHVQLRSASQAQPAQQSTSLLGRIARAIFG